jgi:hypothetical protein
MPRRVNVARTQCFRGMLSFMSVVGSSALAVSMVLALAAPAWAEGEVSYAQASGYFKQDSRPTLYQPLGLLDGRDATAWCSRTSDPLSELLSFGFDAPTTVDELKVTTGNNFDDGTFAEFARGRKFRLATGKQSFTFTLEDARGPQPVAVSPPLKGTRFTLEVLDQHPAEDPDQPVCVTDVVFMTQGKPLNGPWMTAKLKYDKHVAQVMGTWFAGFDKTPDRFLSFNHDGTFRYSFEPYDARRAKEQVVRGRYDVSAGRLVLTVADRKHQVGFSVDRTRDRAVLKLSGELPEELKADWRSSP